MKPGTDEFYVGYLPVPWGHSRFLRVLVPTALWLLVFFGMGLAWSQRDPGQAVWNDGVEETWEGTILADPYPILLIGEGDSATAALLVEQGKRGAQQRVALFANTSVRVRGWRLERDGRRIIELAPDPDAITRSIAAPAIVRQPDPPADRVTLHGEIMDAKCFLGAMKPGEGATHRACATLCITGGIPPMLVVRDPSGRASYYLVTHDQGGPMPTELRASIGIPVELTGHVSRLADLNVIRTRPTDVTPSTNH